MKEKINPRINGMAIRAIISLKYHEGKLDFSKYSATKLINKTQKDTEDIKILRKNAR